MMKSSLLPSYNPHFSLPAVAHNMTTITRQLRIAQNLTQEALAKKALVTRYVVRTLESPEWHKIEPQHIKLVADALGVSTEVLLGKKTQREEILDKQIDLYAALNRNSKKH